MPQKSLVQVEKNFLEDINSFKQKKIDILKDLVEVKYKKKKKVAPQPLPEISESPLPDLVRRNNNFFGDKKKIQINPEPEENHTRNLDLITSQS